MREHEQRVEMHRKRIEMHRERVRDIVERRRVEAMERARRPAPPEAFQAFGQAGEPWEQRVAELHERMSELELQRAELQAEIEASFGAGSGFNEGLRERVREQVREQMREIPRQALRGEGSPGAAGGETRRIQQRIRIEGAPDGPPGPLRIPIPADGKPGEEIELELEFDGPMMEGDPMAIARAMSEKRRALVTVEQELNAVRRAMERAEGMAAATSNPIGRELRDVMIVSEAWSSALDVVDRLDGVVTSPSKLAIYAVLKLEETEPDPEKLHAIYTELAQRPLPAPATEDEKATALATRRMALLKLAELQGKTGKPGDSRDAYLAIIDNLTGNPARPIPREAPAPVNP